MYMLYRPWAGFSVVITFSGWCETLYLEVSLHCKCTVRPMGQLRVANLQGPESLVFLMAWYIKASPSGQQHPQPNGRTFSEVSHTRSISVLPAVMIFRQAKPSQRLCRSRIEGQASTCKWQKKLSPCIY